MVSALKAARSDRLLVLPAKIRLMRASVSIWRPAMAVPLLLVAAARNPRVDGQHERREAALPCLRDEVAHQPLVVELERAIGR